MSGADVRNNVQTRPRRQAFIATGDTKDHDALLPRTRPTLPHSSSDGNTAGGKPRRSPVNVMAMVNKFNSQEQINFSSEVASPANTENRLSRSASFGDISRSDAFGDDWVKLDHTEAAEAPPTISPPTLTGSRTPPKPPARRKKFTGPAEPTVKTPPAKTPFAVPPRVNTVLPSAAKVNGVSENHRAPPRPPPPNLKPTKRLSPHQLRKEIGQPSREGSLQSIVSDAHTPSSNSFRRSSTYSETSSLTDSFDESSQYRTSGLALTPYSPGPAPPSPSSTEGRRSELEESYDVIPEMSLKFDDMVEKVKKRDSKLHDASIYEVAQAVAREIPHCASTGELPATINGFPTEGRERIILELYTTEYKYVQQLEVIVEVYMLNLRSVLFDDMSHIFNNVEDILAFNRGFLALLHRRLVDWDHPQQCIGDIFIGMFNQTHKSMYAIYCSNYDNAEQRVLKIRKRKDVEDALKQCQASPAVLPGLTLPMYLITPVQRIPRYILLLKDIIKKTPDDHPDYSQLLQAEEKMGELASYINLQIKETQTKKTLQHLRSKVTGLSDLTHDPNRKLVKEGQVYLKNIKKLYQCILFNDLLVFALGDSRQSTVELQLPLEALWVEDLEDRDPQTSSEDAVELYTPQRPYTMYVRSNSEKKLWLPKLVETIYHHLFSNNKCDRSDSLVTVKRYAEFVYQDQRFYTGWYVDSLCHGKGTMTWPNQVQYVGDWVDDMRCGEGELRFNTGERYNGRWAEDKQNGFGELHYANGDVYKGTWKDGQRHGKAHIYYSNGDKFEGQFVSGHIEGRGKLQCVNGVEYVGEWKNSHRHGQGTLKTQQGNVYTGEFRQNQIHGQGRIQYFNGDTYSGAFKNGLRQGTGVFISQNEGRYEGSWDRDLRCGKGEMRYKNGDTYEGFWEFDKRHGKGTLKYKTGEQYAGEFKFGLINGKGEKMYGKGASYSGEWANGMRNGKGKMTYTDKSVYDGDWKMDLRHGQGDYQHEAKGISYSGGWEHNLPHGEGELRIKNKTEDYQYKGQWVAGSREGKGLEQSQYGTYDGWWRYDMKHGHGEERSTVNTTFKGQWERGRKHGSGERKLPFGLIEEQRWKSGQLLSDNQRMTAVELPFLSRSDL